MGLFSKKNRQEEQPIPAVPVVPQESSQEKVQSTLEGARRVLDELIEGLEELQDQAVWDKAAKHAREYEQMRQIQMQNAEEGEENYGDYMDKLFFTTDDLELYMSYIDNYYRIFRSFNAADSVSKGANEIDECVRIYIPRLKEALQQGQKLKANACIEVLKYDIKVAHGDIGETDPEKLRKLQENRMSYVSKDGTFASLMELILELYEKVSQLRIDQDDYKVRYEAWKDIEKSLDAVPDEIKQRLDALGFKNAMRDLPVGDQARAFLPKIVYQSAQLSQVKLLSLKIETLQMKIAISLAKVEELVRYLKEAYEKNIYNTEMVERELNRRREESKREIDSMQADAVSFVAMNDRLDALVESAAANAQLGEAVTNSRRKSKEFAEIIAKNEEMEQQIEEMRKAAKQKEQEAQEEQGYEQENTRIEADQG